MMPTIKEIAETCGVTKPTVTRRLKELELWSGHVNRSNGTFKVDDFAASAIADDLLGNKRAAAEPEQKTDPTTLLIKVYEGRAADANRTIEILQEQLQAKDEQIAALTARIADLGRPHGFLARLLGRGE